jgi:hypothetical protein
MTDNDTPSDGPSHTEIDPRVLEPLVLRTLARALPDAIESSNDFRKAFQELLSSGPGRRILDGIGRDAVDDALKVSLERRFGRMEKKIDKRVEDSSNTIMATLRGSIEGKILNALASATQSKEFRELLQEITIFSAQQAIKDSAGPLFENLREEFQAGLLETIEETVTSIEDRLGKVVSENVEAFTAKPEFRDAVTGVFEAGSDDILKPVLEKISEGGDLAKRIDEEVLPGLGELRGQLEALTKGLEDIRESLGRQMEAQQSLASEVFGSDGESGLDERIRQLASDVVQNHFEQRLAPELEKFQESLAGPDDTFLKKIILDELFGERVKVLASEERREARGEMEDLFKEALERSGITSDGIPRDAIEEIVSESITASLKDVKALARRIEPIVREMVEAQGGADTSQFLPQEEIQVLIETQVDMLIGTRLTESAEKSREVDEFSEGLQKKVKKLVKEHLDKNIGETLTMVAGSGEIKTALKSAIDEQLVENTLLENAIQAILATDEIKEMIDDRFRTIRMFLKNEEIPKIVKKLLKEHGG